MFSHSIIALFGLVAALPAVYGHAGITSPPIRGPGPNFVKTCGQASFDSVKGDPTGHIEEQTPFNAGCEPTLCRGMPFSDQPASNVQKVQPGQAMAMGVDCTIPHGGPANVSLIDTTGGGAGQFIGSFLKTFDDFCPTSGVTPADQTNLQFTLPESDVIGNKCQTAGDCVVQLFWATPDFTQNYYYCVDVQIPSAAVAAAPVATTSSTPATSSTAATVASSSVVSDVSSAAASSTSATPVSSSTAVATTSSISSVVPTTSSSLPITTSVAATSSLPITTTIPVSSSTPSAAAPVTTAPAPSSSDSSESAAPLVMVTITSFAPMPSVASSSNTNETVAGAALGSGAGRRVALPGVFAMLKMLAMV